MIRPSPFLALSALRVSVAWALFLPFPLLAADSNPPAAVTGSASNPGSVSAISLDEYRARLQSLRQLVASCQSAMTPANCQSDRVGPDLQLALASGVRSVRFAWLRGLLDRAAKGEPDAPKAASAKAGEETAPGGSGDDESAEAQPPPEKGRPLTSAHAEADFTPPTLTQQLDAARQRLAADEQAASLAERQPTALGAPPAAIAAHPPQDAGSQRQALARILAAPEYHVAVAGPSLLDRLWEAVENRIDAILAKLREAGLRSQWVGIAAEIAFVVAICVALAWFLIRLERRGRLGPALLGTVPGAGAASARDWQLWLADARGAAAEGAWRNAIHFLYWASIARLESSGLWPADRARTPREYLALLAPESAQRAELASLTRSFERTWYAGRPAAEADFQQAELLAAQLGAQQSHHSASRRKQGQGAP